MLWGFGWLLWIWEMEEKEILWWQICLLQGLIDDYKIFYGNVLVFGILVVFGWQLFIYYSGRVFSVCYFCLSWRGYFFYYGFLWCKKYFFVNWFLGFLDFFVDYVVWLLYGVRGGQFLFCSSMFLRDRFSLVRVRMWLLKLNCY